MRVTRISASATLQGVAKPTRKTVAGNLTMGHTNSSVTYAAASHTIYVRNLRIFDSSTTAALDLASGTAEVSAAYVAPTAQVETATAAGTITLAGNATVTVTAAAVTGSPVTLSVPVTLGDTAAVWAAKVRTALSENAAIAAKFTVGGSSTAIVLTRIIDDAGVADDSTLNIALANGTCTGITPAATSANTTEGTLATGALWDETTGIDAEGVALPSTDGLKAISILGVRGEMEYEDGDTIIKGAVSTGGRDLKAAVGTLSSSGDLVFNNPGIVAVAEIIITVVLATA